MTFPELKCKELQQEDPTQNAAEADLGGPAPFRKSPQFGIPLPSSPIDSCIPVLKENGNGVFKSWWSKIIDYCSTDWPGLFLSLIPFFVVQKWALTGSSATVFENHSDKNVSPFVKDRGYSVSLWGWFKSWIPVTVSMPEFKGEINTDIYHEIYGSKIRFRLGWKKKQKTFQHEDNLNHASKVWGKWSRETSVLRGRTENILALQLG